FTARRMREEDVRRITPLRSVVVLGFSAGEVAVDVIASRSAPVIGVPVLPHRFGSVGLGPVLDSAGLDGDRTRTVGDDVPAHRSRGHRFASEHNRLLGRFERRAPPLPLLGLGNTGRVLASVRYRLWLTHLPVDAVRDLVFGPTPG